jgi:hypothetical protein
MIGRGIGAIQGTQTLSALTGESFLSVRYPKEPFDLESEQLLGSRMGESNNSLTSMMAGS